MDFYKSGNWTVFPNSILSQLQLSDCDDTIDGICHSTKNLQECIDLCANDQLKQCRTGYFIETENGDTFCAPLRQYSEDETSPYYRLRNKSYYPILNNMKTYVFSNYPFPPNLPNVMFYTDHFILKNDNSKKYIGFEEDTQKIDFVDSQPLHLQLLPKQISQGNVEAYVYVKNGDDVVINIPKTAFTLGEKEEGKIDWIMRASVINLEGNTFKIFCKNKKVGDILDYTDKVYFTLQGLLLVYDQDTKSLITKNELNQQDENSTFSLIPKVQVYYCSSSSKGSQTCQSISLDETDTNGFSASYKGSPVERSPNCWGLCPKKEKDFFPFLIILLIVLVIVFLIILKK